MQKRAVPGKNNPNRRDGGICDLSGGFGVIFKDLGVHCALLILM